MIEAPALFLLGTRFPLSSQVTAFLCELMVSLPLLDYLVLHHLSFIYPRYHDVIGWRSFFVLICCIFPDMCAISYLHAMHEKIGLISWSVNLPLPHVRMAVPASLYNNATTPRPPHLSRVRLTFTLTSVDAFILRHPWWLSLGLAAQSSYTFYCGKMSFHRVQLIHLCVFIIVTLLASS